AAARGEYAKRGDRPGAGRVKERRGSEVSHAQARVTSDGPAPRRELRRTGVAGRVANANRQQVTPLRSQSPVVPQADSAVPAQHVATGVTDLAVDETRPPQVGSVDQEHGPTLGS